VSNKINIPKSGGLDFLSLGALVNRLDPGIIPFRKATHCDIHVSGGEFNVSANLSDCFRLNTGIASAMVDYPIGDLIAERVRAMGVKPFYKKFKHDGVRGPNMATVYSDRGQGVRAPVVFYNRSNEAAGQLKPGDFNWNEIFGSGVRWLHSGGIFAALSETTGELIIEAMKAAKANGAITSFDLNYRQKLWDIWGGQSKAVDVLARIVANVDVLVGNEEDLQKGLGIEGQDVEAKSKLDPSAFYAVIEKATKKFPNVKAVATTLREVHSTNRHTWGAVAWIGGKNVSVAHVRTRRRGPRWRRRRLCGRLLLRPTVRRVRAGSGESWLGARRAADHVPRRHYDGDGRAGQGVRQGRFRPHPALILCNLPAISLLSVWPSWARTSSST
jgi:2-dehydro-3-deoxygluconokinase